jgi:hypothetical protein
MERVKAKIMRGWAAVMEGAEVMVAVKEAVVAEVEMKEPQAEGAVKVERRPKLEFDTQEELGR